MSVMRSEDWPVVIVESPFAPSKSAERDYWWELTKGAPLTPENATLLDLWRKAQLEIHHEYALACCADCLKRREVPYASHLFFPLILNEFNSLEREIGLTAGYAMWRAAGRIVFYLDKGWSPGMLRAKARADELTYLTEERTLNQENRHG